MDNLRIEWFLDVVFQDRSEQEAIRQIKREQCNQWAIEQHVKNESVKSDWDNSNTY